MLSHRPLHFAAAFVLVMGMFAVTNSSVPAMSRPSAFAQSNAARAGVGNAIESGVRVPASIRTASPSVRREVFGFALADSLSDPTFGYPSWHFSLLSTVAFFGLHINWNGAIVSDSGLSVWNSSTLSGLVSAAHAAGTKVVLTIVLQDFQPGTPNMCAGLINRSVTVKQAVAQVAGKGVNGLNVDYEGLNGTCQNGQTARAMMTDFVRQLRAALPSGSYLSVDTYAGAAADPLGFFDIGGLNAYVDSFFVMAYDLEYSNYHYAPINCVSFCLGPTAPLTGYRYNDTSTAAQYAAVVPASKIILGVPYYGRKSCVGAAAPNAYPRSAVIADSYLDASAESMAPGVSRFTAHRDANDPSGKERWDTWFNSSLGCTRELYWDDAVSLGAKYDLVNADNLRGVGIWTLNYGGGAPELWSALSTHFAGCKGLSVTASPSTAAIGTTVALTANGTGCPSANPLYEFWILSPGGTSYQLAQAYSTNAVFKWSTTGKTAGGYVVAAWVRDASSTGNFGNQFGRWDAYSSVQVKLVSVPCASVGVSFAPSSPATVGTSVTVTAHSSGCSNPQYEFWFLPPGGAAYQLARAYSSSATLQWGTSGKPAGTYTFATWVRDSSSAGTSGNQFGRWDAYTISSYVVVVPCSAVSVSVAPASPATVGTSVRVTAQAAGCANPRYEFWLRPPGVTAYQLVQAYSSTGSLSWSTSGMTAGTYSFATWVRDAASPGASGNQFGRWDAYTFSLFTLVTVPCSSVDVSFAPTASTAVGIPVTATAHANGCPHPLYEFWVRPPGGTTYQLAQAYSTSATLQWSTASRAAGTYVFSTWVRDASSTGTSSNQFGGWDAYAVDTYAIVTPCSGVTVTSSPAASAATGTTVTFTAHASGCLNPQYQFWIQAPGSTSYQLVQAYSTSTTFTWSTGGRSPGTFTLAIWARDAGSPGTGGNQAGRWDAYGFSQYTLS